MINMCSPMELNMSAIGRIVREMRDGFSNSELYTIECEENDLYNWRAVIRGQPNTKLAGLQFHLEILISNRYPFQPPIARFVGKKSEIPFCEIDILHDSWSPALTIDKLVLSIYSVLMDGTRFEASLLAFPECA